MMFSRSMMLALGVALVLGCNEPTGPLASPAAVGRPAEVSQGPRVGVIVTHGGNVTIIPATGPAFAGTPEMQLLRDDKLVTAADSFVVVQLHNGHLVRLGANQRNVVEMLAPFHDPPAADDLEARFVRLLTPDERDDPALRGAITRVAGWNTRMSAAQTFAALPASAAPAPVVEEAPPAAAPAASPPGTRGGLPPGDEADSVLDGAGGGAAKLEDTPVDEGKPPPPKPPPARGPVADKKTKGPVSPADDARANRGAPAPGEAEKADQDESAPGSSNSPPPPPQLPPQLRFTPAGGGAAKLVELPTPLKGAAGLAKCAGAGAKIAGRVKDLKLVALTVDGAARCQELVGKASTLADGTFELTVKP